MIEEVEEFSSEFERLALCQAQILQQRHVEIVDSRTVEEPAIRRTQFAQVFDEKREVLKYGFCPDARFCLRGLVICKGPGTKFGASRQAPVPLLQVPSSDRSSFSVRNTGKPVLKRVIPVKIHPLVNRFARPSWSKGSS